MNTLKSTWVLMLILCCTSSFFAQSNLSDNKDSSKPVPKSNSKVSAVLLKLYDNEGKTGDTEDVSLTNTDVNAVFISGKNVLIEASAKKDGQALARMFQQLHAEDVQVSGRIVNAWFPVKNIPKLESMEELQYVKPVYKPITNIGSIDSEGDSALAANIARSQYCLDGTGIKVGVLSDSYNSLLGASAGVASGDLPGAGNPNGYTTPVTVVSDLALGTGSDEGRAMCEIVHDLSPGSELFYATAFTGQAGFANSIKNLSDINGCDVIVDDVSYFEEPFYMDGVIAQACDYVKASGVSYLSSAGNQAQTSYEAAFNASPNSTWHDFDPGAGVDTMQSITINAGSNLNIAFQWDDPWGSLTPNGAQTDMDIYIYNSTGTAVLIQSIRDNINVTLDPSELLQGSASGTGTVALNIAIHKYSGPSPSAMKWVAWGGGLVINEYASTTVSGQATCVGHANAAGAMAVGASPWFSSPAYGVNPPLPEPFTSSGGTQILYDLNGNSITPIDRFKPDFTATDGTSNTFFGSNNFFFGTSAAAPHAAAVAALMLQANPSITPTEVRNILKNSAIDMNTPGFDYLTGAGLIQADVAIQQVYHDLCNISNIALEKGPDLEPGDTTFSVEVKVEYSGATCNDSLVVNGEKFEITNPDSMTVLLTGLPVNGQSVDVTAVLPESTGCSLTSLGLFMAPSIVSTIDTLIFSEIMYNPPESNTDSLEFVEIYNPMNRSVNLMGYYFSEGVNFTFGNLIISSNSYVVICKDSLALFRQFGAKGYQWSGVLNNGGEDIVLKNPQGVTIDSVDYDDSSPWPLNANGNGPSLVLCDASTDNNLGANWTESTSLTGKTINGFSLKGSPGTSDAACGLCPTPDSTFAVSTSCDTTLAGISSYLYQSANGCDSVHTITTVYDSGDSISMQAVEICVGDSAFVFGKWQSMAGVYYDSTLNVNGCDSVTSQQLILNPNHNEILVSTNICMGDSALIFGQWRTMSAIYFDTLQTQKGCDSILSQELFVDSVITSSVEETICFGDSIFIFGNWETHAGVYQDTSISLQGCDSIYTVILSTLPLTSGNDVVEICEGDSVLIGSTYATLAGVYYDTLNGGNGCDSIVSTSVVVNPIDTTYNNLTTSNPLQAGIFDTTFTNSNGCDSTVITTVTFVPSSIDTLVITEIMYNPPESRTDSLEFIEIYNPTQSAISLAGYYFGSGVTYNFGNVLIPSMGYIVVCKDSSAMYNQFGVSAYEWSGVLSNPGELIILKDGIGNTIDSVHYANAGVWPLGADGDGPSIVLCDWTSDNSNGANWTESASSTGIIINGNTLVGSPGFSDAVCGPCPSVDSVFVESSTCDSSQAGISVALHKNKNGCDSVVTTTIIFDPGSSTSLPNKAICHGDSTLIFGAYQMTSGTYYDSLINKNGCDSILSCVLSVKRSDTIHVLTTTLDSTFAGVYDTVYTNTEGCDSLVITTVVYVGVPCSNDSVTVYTNSCDSSSAGTSISSYQKPDGCDSIVTTITAYDPGSYAVLPSKSICAKDSILIFGDYQMEAGTYYDSLQNINGCDSILSCDLTVNPVVTVNAVDSICAGDGRFIGGSYQTTAGVYYDTLITTNGCDSLVVTTLTIRTDTACLVKPAVGDSIVIVTDSGWMKSTVTNTIEARGYPWPGVSSLPATSTYILPVEIGQPYPWHSIDSVDGAHVFKTGNGVTFFRTTFSLTVDTGVRAQIRSFMDDGMEMYINGHMLAREDDRETSNFTGAQHNLLLLADGSRSNGHNGDQEFDVVNNYRMDSLVNVGQNELVIALRNAPQTSDKGGFSFRMDIKTGEPYQPLLIGYIVSDAEWMKSTSSTAGGSSWSWNGISGLPPSNSYTQEVKLGQPYGWYSTEEVDESYAIKAGENVSYYRRRFSLVDSADINVRLRSTFDENLMVFVNDSLIAGNFQHGLANRTLPPHDAAFPNGGVAVNGNAGGDMFMQLENVDFNQILRRNNNYITVALQNRANDQGGFSLRLDLDKAGNPVIRKVAPKSDDAASTLVKSDLDFEIYPNPTSAKVNIELTVSYAEENEITVSDVNGKVLMRQYFMYSPNSPFEFDLSDYPKGVYLVRVRSGKVFKAKPVIRF